MTVNPWTLSLFLDFNNALLLKIRGNKFSQIRLISAVSLQHHASFVNGKQGYIQHVCSSVTDSFVFSLNIFLQLKELFHQNWCPDIITLCQLWFFTLQTLITIIEWPVAVVQYQPPLLGIMSTEGWDWQKASFTTSVSRAPPHDPSHDHCTGGVVPPDGGSLEHTQENTVINTAEQRSSFSSPRSSITTHQGLLVLHQPDNLHRLFLQLVLKVVRQRRQHRVKVLLRHGVMHREHGLMGQKTAMLRSQCWPWAVARPNVVSDRWSMPCHFLPLHLEMRGRQQVQQLLLLGAHRSALELLCHLRITTNAWALCVWPGVNSSAVSPTDGWWEQQEMEFQKMSNGMIQQFVNNSIPLYTCTADSERANYGWMTVVGRCVCVINIHPLPEKRHCAGLALDSVAHTVSASHESGTQTCREELQQAKLISISSAIKMLYICITYTHYSTLSIPWHFILNWNRMKYSKKYTLYHPYTLVC